MEKIPKLVSRVPHGKTLRRVMKIYAEKSPPQLKISERRPIVPEEEPRFDDASPDLKDAETPRSVKNDGAPRIAKDGVHALTKAKLITREEYKRRDWNSSMVYVLERVACVVGESGEWTCTLGDADYIGYIQFERMSDGASPVLRLGNVEIDIDEDSEFVIPKMCIRSMEVKIVIKNSSEQPIVRYRSYYIVPSEKEPIKRSIVEFEIPKRYGVVKFKCDGTTAYIHPE